MSNYITHNNEDIFAVVNKTIGDLNSIYDFLKENVAVTIALVPALLSVTYEPATLQPPLINSLAPPTAITSKDYRSRQNQNFFDILLMTTTDLNQAYDVLLASNFNNINVDPKTNTLFKFNPNLVRDNILSREVGNKKIIFTTGTWYDKGVPVTANNKEFEDSILFEFQTGTLYDFQ